MSSKLDILKAAFKKNDDDNSGSGGGGNYYPFWNMPMGQSAVVRFLPDKNDDNPLQFLVEKFTHRLDINGERKTVPCLKMYGEECPICKLSQSYYKQGDKTNGKKYWRSKQHLGQVIVVDDPLPANEETGETHEGQLRFISIGWQLFEVIKDSFESGDLDEVPYAFSNGTDFNIKKSEQGEYASYSVGSKFVRKERDLTEEEIAIYEENGVDLTSLLPANPGYEYIEAMLQAEINGGPMPTASGSGNDAVADIAAQAKKALAGDDDDEGTGDDDGGDLDADEIIARIRNRNKS